MVDRLTDSAVHRADRLERQLITQRFGENRKSTRRKRLDRDEFPNTKTEMCWRSEMRQLLSGLVIIIDYVLSNRAILA